MLQLAALMPHPPIAVLEVGGKEAEKVAKTRDAMKEVARLVRKLEPQVIVAITPHGNVFSDTVTLTAVDPLEGDLGNFDASEVRVSYNLDQEVVKAILAESTSCSFPCAALNEAVLKQLKLGKNLDHGLVVPLSFLGSANEWGGKLVPINMAFLPYEELYEFGRILSRAFTRLNKRWVLLISGDMSHRLTPGAPAGYSPQGKVFDNILRKCLKEGDIKKLIHLDPDLVEDAGECGLRPLIMALGAFDGYELEAQELSYEGPFGVGYLVTLLQRGREKDNRNFAAQLYQDRRDRLEKIKAQESLLVTLARQSIKSYLLTSDYADINSMLEEVSSETQELLGKKAGCFVSLKKHGQLRGCIGTIEAQYSSLGNEIIHNSVAAALHDPRFEPLELSELEDLTISVDVMGVPEKITDIQDLNPQSYGVIVRRGNRTGLLLPDLPGINSGQEQVRIAKEKAGIGRKEQVELERFKVERYT